MAVLPMLVEPMADTFPWESAYVSEKFDGWRMIYNRGVFYTRKGNVINLHPAIYKEMLRLPQDIIYDGELWLGYGTFSMLPTLVAGGTTAATAAGAKPVFKVFDIIVDGPFEGRLQQMREIFEFYKFTYVHMVEHKLVVADSEVDAIYDEVISRGGEGIVLRNPAGIYERDKRSKNILKKKPLETTELLVIGHYSTPGSAAVGIVSSLICKTINGGIVKVTVHTTTPAPVGSIVSIAHSQYTVSGLPKFARFIGIRPDVDIDPATLAVFRSELAGPMTDEPVPIVKKKARTTTKAATPIDRTLELSNKACRGVFTAKQLKDRGGASLDHGSFILFDNEKGRLYKVAKARMSDHIYCSCEAWKFQRLPPISRTCKHCEMAKGGS